ncbi:exodeoxyribonuclease III [Pseudoxanthomonas sp. 10H]|uniref:exodeoxyribonuclease III n=1 Tax=Pseudoxanthomonas sp. 10H TaxID=3242729 RepID=UPI003555FB31
MARRLLTLATFNVNGIGARLPHLLAWLAREKPDVVALQELKALDAAFPVAELEAAGYGALWQGQRSWNGVALLGRGVVPVESRRGLPGDAKDTQSRYLEAAVHGVLVAAIYAPNGNPQPGPKFDYKLRWMQRLARHARTLAGQPVPVALLGDFNVVPTDADIYDPKGWRRDALLQPEAREAYRDLLAQGWTDALHQVHGDAPVFTFWDYFRQHAERDRGLRIDHLLLNPVLAATLKDAGVHRWVRLQEKASDHAPTWARVAAPARR